MRDLWRNLENKQSQKAIVGSACNSKIVYIEVTLGLLLAGITMSLSGCGGPARTYYYQSGLGSVKPVEGGLVLRWNETSLSSYMGPDNTQRGANKCAGEYSSPVASFLQL